jgi:hypothetical protein
MVTVGEVGLREVRHAEEEDGWLIRLFSSCANVPQVSSNTASSNIIYFIVTTNHVHKEREGCYSCCNGKKGEGAAKSDT